MGGRGDDGMRVLHVTPYFAPAFVYGGPPRSILGLCRSLRRLGVDAEVFTTTANGAEDLPASPAPGARQDDVPVRYFPRAFPRRIFGARGLDAALRRDVALYDVVHVHGLWNLPVWQAARRARRARVPYVVSPRGMLNAGAVARRRRRKRFGYWAVERRNLAGAAFLHATSEAEATALDRHRLGVPIVTLPNGVEVESGGGPAPGAFRRRLGLGADVPLIAFLGRIHPTKRLDLLAAAFDRVRAACEGARLVVAGPDENGHRREVEPRFREAGEAVRWTGELDEADKCALLADADALVMCSDSESFGMSVVEALAAGVPVVVTETCPWPEVQAAGCGFFVPQSPDAIASALVRLLGDRAAARRMGERGRALARSRYSWDSIARAMADRYEAVAGARGAIGAP